LTDESGMCLRDRSRVSEIGYRAAPAHVGADANAVGAEGRTALLSAIWSDDSNTHVVRAPIEAGADKDLSDTTYRISPREWALKAEKIEVARLLAETG